MPLGGPRVTDSDARRFAKVFARNLGYSIDVKDAPYSINYILYPRERGKPIIIITYNKKYRTLVFRTTSLYLIIVSVLSITSNSIRVLLSDGRKMTFVFKGKKFFIKI